ncbi:hypothetical protein GTCCBUS3UF5_18260 [Geobacillus thermoleovorans CCB_US3_UF5]|uniref:Uncharacterized protein n=2 Tax=Geobacillus thermoleovorans group TaxID=1505648 RepID=U2WTI7_GEOKU|nr:hypothetical protein GTCCBUS3UF5_18260 [Geobacillus thermoleovorans CCB_US3_UF5]GAD14091.1 hypothetical protein GBL_2308 [Geobacillus kaustophilus GBlys]GAJ59061.1 hypothetical protein B23_2285 [Geobacillus thermoleovorans B23]
MYQLEAGWVYSKKISFFHKNRDKQIFLSKGKIERICV